MTIRIRLAILLSFFIGCGGQDPSPSTCTMSTCNGCCDHLGQCQQTTSSSACGLNGKLCVICAADEDCVLGQCTKTCSAANCPSGCCQGNQCMAGNTDQVCGRSGNPCGQCQNNYSCVNQICIQGTQSCNASNCASGCCQGTQCLAGNTNQACGKGGNACLVCQPSQTCLNNACSGTTCDPTNCNGCCTSTICRTGNDNLACGQGGQTCVDCTKFGVCSAHQCTVTLQSEWKVSVLSAKIDPQKECDKDALPGFKTCDAFIRVQCGGKSGETLPADETQAPVYNQEVLTVTAGNLTQAIKLEVWDKDLIPPDELIGECTVTATTTDLAHGSRTFTNCGGTDVQEVSLGFVPK